MSNVIRHHTNPLPTRQGTCRFCTTVQPMPSLGGVWGSRGMMNIKGTGRFLEDPHTSQQVSNRSNIIQRTSCSRTYALFTARIDRAQD